MCVCARCESNARRNRFKPELSPPPHGRVSVALGGVAWFVARCVVICVYVAHVVATADRSAPPRSPWARVAAFLPCSCFAAAHAVAALTHARACVCCVHCSVWWSGPRWRGAEAVADAEARRVFKCGELSLESCGRRGDEGGEGGVPPGVPAAHPAFTRGGVRQAHTGDGLRYRRSVVRVRRRSNSHRVR